MIQIDETALAGADNEKITLDIAENEVTYWAGQMAQNILRIGRALKVIRDGDLFREGGFDSFAAYLDARAFKGWTIGQTQGYKYIKVFERYGNRLESLGCSNLEVLYTLKDTPDDEIEKLADNGRLSDMTVKDARDYKKELEAAQEQISFLEDTAKKYKDDLKSERELYDTLSEDYDRIRKVNESLQNENRKLSERPIEVVSPSDEDIAGIKAEARREAEADIKKEYEKQSKDKIKSAVAAEQAKFEEENNNLRKTLEKLTAEKESSENRIKKLEQELQSTEKGGKETPLDENLIEFRFYFNEVQNYMQKFLDVIDKVNDPGKQEKFRGAALKYLETVLNDLGGDDD